jgi:hypothetical protein
MTAAAHADVHVLAAIRIAVDVVIQRGIAVAFAGAAALGSHVQGTAP